jgi:membrane peptidoglycan carboxypeptidase
MYSEGYLSEAEYETAIGIPVNASFLKISPPSAGCIAANEYAKYFCDYVVKNVENFESLGGTPEERTSRWRIGGLDVYTTLNLSLQTIAKTAYGNWCPARKSALISEAPPPVWR